MSSAEMESAAALTQGDAWDKFPFRGIALFLYPSPSPGLCARPEHGHERLLLARDEGTRWLLVPLGAAPKCSHQFLGFSPSPGLLQELWGFPGSGTGQPRFLGCILLETAHSSPGFAGSFLILGSTQLLQQLGLSEVPTLKCLSIGSLKKKKKKRALLVLNHTKKIRAEKLLGMLSHFHFFSCLPKICCAFAFFCFVSCYVGNPVYFKAETQMFSSHCSYQGLWKKGSGHVPSWIPVIWKGGMIVRVKTWPLKLFSYFSVKKPPQHIAIAAFVFTGRTQQAPKEILN